MRLSLSECFHVCPCEFHDCQRCASLIQYIPVIKKRTTTYRGGAEALHKMSRKLAAQESHESEDCNETFWPHRAI
ncbi:hypothetical protein MITSMUL_04520 [Mitsuokella multacida DSM 20544]|uniref:Uncharacterized protein n=1 Tax=Mitsuokella multacida DSM 20544 TaxID=500635 RepID=C9KMS8_9FIRM|nr:hypothetical protein MITSMUL_04520 [Mitsuokella multacida DSM 20544]